MLRKIDITTLTTAAIEEIGQPMCEVGRTCEGVHALADRPEHYYVIVTEVTNPAELAAFAPRLGTGEKLGTVRRRIIDEVQR